jgi:hypothetical protein
MKEMVRKSWIRALQFWVSLCEIRVGIINHAILSAAIPKTIEKLQSDRDRVLVSSHAARLRLERLRKL